MDAKLYEIVRYCGHDAVVYRVHPGGGADLIVALGGRDTICALNVPRGEKIGQWSRRD